MISLRLLPVVLGTGAVAIVLSGCKTAEPTALPEVIIEHPGSADLDDNEFVVALRASELARAMAWNSGDFTISPLTESTVAADIDFDYDYRREELT